jgi:hypothetical protein
MDQNTNRNYDQKQHNHRPYERPRLGHSQNNRHQNFNSHNSNYHQKKRFHNQQNRFKIFDKSRAEFYIHPYSAFDGPFPKFDPPIEVGTMISESKENNIASKKRFLYSFLFLFNSRAQKVH